MEPFYKLQNTLAYFTKMWKIDKNISESGATKLFTFALNFVPL